MDQRSRVPQTLATLRTSTFALFAGYTNVGRALLVGLLLAGTGCEEAVDPIIGTDIPFTVWGFMNAGADTQLVRVFPVSDDLIPEEGAALDARVYSTDLTTGEWREWTYKRVAFDSLIAGHVFWAPFRAEYEHRYRLEVVRSDGETSSATVTVPPPVDFQIDVREGDVEVPLQIKGDVPNLVGLRITYHGINVPPAKAWPVGTDIAPPVELSVTIRYDNAVERTENGWEALIDMARDLAAVQHVYHDNCLITGPAGSAPDIWLRSMEFSVLAADSSWAPPGGAFDINVLSQPGTFSNVENGYGFFGAGQGVRHQWTPSVASRFNAGYTFEPKCNGLSPTPTLECMNPPVPCLEENPPEFWEIWLR